MAQEIEPQEDRSIMELERDFRAIDRAAATALREARSCEKNLSFQLNRLAEISRLLEIRKDRRHAASRELGHPGKRKR